MGNEYDLGFLFVRVAPSAPQILRTLEGIKERLVVLENIDAVLVAVGEPVFLFGIGTPVHLVRTDDCGGILIMIDASGLQFHMDGLAGVAIIKDAVASITLEGGTKERLEFIEIV